MIKGILGLGLTNVNSEIFDQANVIDGESLGDFDNFGFSLAIGDFVERTPRGGLDLAIGIPQESTTVGANTYNFLGAVSIIPGGNPFLAPGSARLWSKGFFDSAGIPKTDEYYGFALAGGDFDGNGATDLAIGVVHAEGQASATVSTANAGAVQILYGALFADGFESGGLGRWNGSVGCPSCFSPWPEATE